MKKWTKRISACTLCAVMTFSFIACKTDNDSSKGDAGAPATITESVSLSASTIALTLGDSATLIASSKGVGEKTLIWASSDPSVATVENGTIVSHNIGSATITVSYGSATDTCEVNVSIGNKMPTLDFEDANQNNITVAGNEKVNFRAEVLFNGKNYSDATFSYEIADNTLGTIEDGIFTPLKSGETTVTVKADWRGIVASSLVKTFNLKVIDSLEYSLPSAMTLYTVGSFDGKTYKTSTPFDLSIKLNGTDVAPISAGFVSGSDIVDLTEDTLSSLKYGEAEYRVEFELAGETIVKNTKIHVKRPHANYEVPITWFSALDGKGDNFDVEELFGAGAQLTDATDANGKALTVNENRVLGVTTSATQMTKTSFTAWTKDVGYTFNVEGYTKVIDSIDDLKTLKGASANDIVKGYYILKNDIGDNTAYAEMNGLLTTFQGTFDGNGHTAYVGLERYGIFGKIGANTVVKDVALRVQSFKYPTQAYGTYSTVLCETIEEGYSKFENLYVKVDSTQTLHRPSLYRQGITANAKFTNVVFELQNELTKGTIDSNIYHYGLSSYDKTGKDGTQTYNNVFVISSTVKHMAHSDGSTQYVCYAANDKALMESESETYSKQFVYSSVLRYDNYTAFEKQIRNVGNWAVQQNELVWNGELEELSTEVSEYEETVTFSALDGELPVSEIFPNETNPVLVAAYYGEKQLTLNGTKVLGIPTSKTELTNLEITVYTKTQAKKVKVQACTLAIDSVDDFERLNVGEGEVLEGYFILTSDIGSPTALAYMGGKNRTFNGTLDGNGHSVYLKLGRAGIFGNLGEAVVKNIAFIVEDYETPKDVWGNNTTILCENAGKAKFENIYVKVTSTETLIRPSLYKNNRTTTATFKNVIFDFQNTIEADSSGNVQMYGISSYDNNTAQDGSGVYENVFVISSTMKHMAHSDKGIVWYASNDTKLMESENELGYTQYQYSTVERYDDYASLSEKTTLVGNWEITEEGIAWKEVQTRE